MLFRSFGPLLVANLAVGNANGVVVAGVAGGLLAAVVALRRWMIRRLGRDPEQI